MKRPVIFKSRKLMLFFFDILCFFVVNACYVVGVVLDTSLNVRDPAKFVTNFVVLALLVFTCRLVFGFYNNIWRYTYTRAYLLAIVSDLVGGTLAVVVFAIARRELKLWYFVIIVSLFTLLTLKKS